MNSASTKNAASRNKAHKLLIQFLEYMVGGGLYFWSGLGIFALCYNLFGWHWLIAKGLADIIGWTLNYLVQRYWAFSDSRLKGKDRRVIFRYVLVNTVDFIIDYAIVALIIHLGYTPYAGFFISAFFTTIWDYLWYKFWVFKVEKTK